MTPKSGTLAFTVSQMKPGEPPVTPLAVHVYTREGGYTVVWYPGNGCRGARRVVVQAPWYGSGLSHSGKYSGKPPKTPEMTLNTGNGPKFTRNGPKFKSNQIKLILENHRIYEIFMIFMIFMIFRGFSRIDCF